MEIKTVVVTAARTFNHPFEQYHNFRPGVTLTASLSDGESAEIAVKELQAQAEKLIEMHRILMLDELQKVQEQGHARERAAALAETLRRAQQEMDVIRRQYPDLEEFLKLPPPQSDQSGPSRW